MPRLEFLIIWSASNSGCNLKRSFLPFFPENLIYYSDFNLDEFFWKCKNKKDPRRFLWTIWINAFVKMENPENYWLSSKNIITNQSISNVVFNVITSWIRKGSRHQISCSRFFGWSEFRPNISLKRTFIDAHVLSSFCTPKKVQINTINLVDESKNCQTLNLLPHIQ